MPAGFSFFQKPAFLLLLLGLTFYVYEPVLDNGFVNWDDNVYVTENQLLRDVSPPGLRKIFTAYVSGNYHPLTVASYAVDLHLFGLSPLPFHLVNLLLHLSVCLLVFLFLQALGITPAGSFAGALLWSLHPLRVEAVAWVSGRKDLLCALFYLASCLAYLSWTARKRALPYALSLCFFLLALLSKATAVTLPAALLLIDFLKRREMALASAVEKIPFLTAAAAFAVLALLSRESYQSVLGEGGYGPGDAVFTGTFRFAFYFLARTLAAVDMPSWLYPPLPESLLRSFSFFLAFVLLGLVAVLVTLSMKKTRKGAFGIGFYFVTLLPVFPVAVLGYSADRFTYLPSVGIAFLAGAFLVWLPGGNTGRRVGLGPASLAVLAGAVLLMAPVTRRRCDLWQDSVTLWTAALERSVSQGVGEWNLAYAYSYRGRALEEKGKLEPALLDFNEALRLQPESAEFLTTRGTILRDLGEHSKAMADLSAAVSLDPAYGRAYLARAILHRSQGRHREALVDLDRAIEVSPRWATALNERGITYGERGVHSNAIADFSRAIALDGGKSEYYFNRGVSRFALGDYDGAGGDFTRAVEVDGTNAAAFHFRARVRLAQGDRRRALEDLARAEELGFPVEEDLRRQAGAPGE